MATATQDVIRRSYIQIVTSTGMVGVTFSSKKKRWMVLYKDSVSGPSRLELYRKEDDTTSPMVIELNTITSVVTVEGRMEFVVSFSDSQVTFACKANADVQDWVSDINKCRGADNDTTHTSNGTALYDAIPGDEVFAVRLRSSQSQSLTFQGACILEIEKNFERNQFHISLFTEQSPRRLIVKWQIDHIRQYGSNETAFKFQSGSKSSTGVGWFVMDTEPGVAGRIHRAVDYWAKYIVEQIRNNQQSGRTRPASSPGFKNSSSPAASSSPKNVPPSVYEPLDPTKRKEQSVYDTVGTEATGQRLAMHQNPANPSQGHYQAIQLPSGASSPPPQPSEYSSLDQSTRESTKGEEAVPPPVIPPRASTASRKNGTQDQYMELKADTRSKNGTQDQYMELKADTRSKNGTQEHYMELNPDTRSKNGTQDQYMELKADTRDQVEPSYMGIERK